MSQSVSYCHRLDDDMTAVPQYVRNKPRIIGSSSQRSMESPDGGGGSMGKTRSPMLKWLIILRATGRGSESRMEGPVEYRQRQQVQPKQAQGNCAHCDTILDRSAYQSRTLPTNCNRDACSNAQTAPPESSPCLRDRRLGRSVFPNCRIWGSVSSR